MRLFGHELFVGQTAVMTPAVKALERADIAHRVVTYDHDPAANSYGAEAAAVLGLDATTVFKTLVATVASKSDHRHVVAVVPVAHRLDLKALANAAGAKKAIMSDPADAARLTGYVVGGISPIGQRTRLATFIDTSAQPLALVYVSGGKRGMEIELTPADLAAATNGQFALLAAA